MLIDVDDVCLIRRGQTDRGQTPRDIMLMYNMPTNIGFCGGESQYFEGSRPSSIL